ncbi:MAG: (2Fe-2S)-binding protein [Firmicutes bacterium]|nr:(2Fe-2S)-binding protein [Bacillota bacterium]
MLTKTGVPAQADIDAIFPCEKRLSLGPVAIIECYQSIPCDPCATACPRGAILPFTDINDRPEIDNDKCTGCILCMTKCPGLAIMTVDAAYSDAKALIRLPYEFVPVPEAGQIVRALDRAGQYVADAEVVQVIRPKNKVTVVAVAVDKHLIKTVRNIGLISQNDADSGIVCRCNDLTVKDIREFIAQGHNSVDELKRMTRLGMGQCQGRNCIPIVMNELSRAMGVPVAELVPANFRPSVKSMKLGEIAAYEEDPDDGCNAVEGAC